MTNLSICIIFLPPRLPKETPGKSRQVSARLDMSVHTQTKAVVSHDTFSWWVSPCNQRTDILLPETLMIKESANLIGQEHFG